jgi:hypothetical protein
MEVSPRFEPGHRKIPSKVLGSSMVSVKQLAGKRHRLVGAVNRFRKKRFALFSATVADVLKTKRGCRILDIGGEPEYWMAYGQELDWSRVKVCMVNLRMPTINAPGLEGIIGDARCLVQFADLSFDIVHSNSVIEHVGRWNDMSAMAREVRRLAPRYFVQTPYFWFPIEPHARFPVFHWMPESWRYRIVMKRACGFWRQEQSVEAAMTAIQSANLIDKRQMQSLFPDARISFERFLGLPKSLIAIR